MTKPRSRLQQAVDYVIQTGCSQNEAAEKFGITRSPISRELIKRGYVSTHKNAPFKREVSA